VVHTRRARSPIIPLIAGFEAMPDASCDNSEPSGVSDDEAAALRLANSLEADPALSERSTTATPAPTSLQDLPALQQALHEGDRYAVNTARCLRSMAALADALPRAQLALLQSDPLMQQVVDIMDEHIHQFTAPPLSTCLWSFAHLQFVPGRCAPCSPSIHTHCLRCTTG
jgi:hypothetical protein